MENIYTRYIASPVGKIGISGTENGITAVTFLEENHAATTATVPLPEPACVQECARQLEEYFAGRRREFDLPLDLQGTDFQKRVWLELLNIGYGKTVSYLHIAEKLGDRNTIRAVGGANGQNKIGIIIPCHRVIGSDGKLTGYAGGMWRKKWLLELENPPMQKSLF